MSFLKNLFGSGKDTPPAAPSYTNFEAGDLCYTVKDDKYQFFKILKVDAANDTVHVLLYHPLNELPAAFDERFQVRVFHAPIDRNGFNQPQLFAKTTLADDELIGYFEYLKQTRNFDEIVPIAQKYYKDAYFLSENGQHEAAIGKYSVAIDLIPNFFEAIDNRAFSKMDLEQWLAAKEDFDLSLQVNPGSFLATYWAAECQLRVGDFGGAKTYFEAALAINPDHERAKELLGVAESMLNR